MAMILDLARIPKHALYLAPSDIHEDGLVFPHGEFFSNLGFALECRRSASGLSLEFLHESDPRGLMILDLRLWNEGVSNELVESLCKEMPESVVLWYVPQDCSALLAGIPQDQLRNMFFFHRESSRRSLLPLVQMAASAQLNRHRWNLGLVNLRTKAIDSTREGVIGMTPDNFIIFANMTALKLLDRDQGSIMYRFREDLFHVERVPRQEPDIFSRPYALLHRWDDQTFKVAYREVKIESDETWPLTIVYLEDIGRELESMQALNVAKLEAQKAAKTKSDFLANISHELRTPLNSILGMTDLALQLADNKEQEEYLRILQISGSSLLQLITSMLDYIKLESGNISLKEKAFPLHELFDSISAQFAIQCHNKGLGFHLVADEKNPVFYVGDEVRLKQVLLNLISNAIKFTQKGEVVIRFRELADDTPQDTNGRAAISGTGELMEPVQLEFQVVDSGMGISRAMQDEIFQPFVQLNVSDQSNTPGTGIGLTITKLLVEAMGGKISVLSEPNRGAIFTFTCRLMRGIMRRNNDLPLSLMHVKTIIAVGDSWGWFDTIQATLKYNQCRIIFCRHAGEIEIALSEFGSDEILFFFQGAYSGTEALFALLGRPQYGPLIHRKHFLTLRLTQDAERAWHSAPFPYKVIYEPLRGSVLLKTLMDLELELNKGDRDAAYGQYHSPYDLKIYYVEDEGLNRVATSRVLSEAGHQVTAFSDGMQLVNALPGADPDFFLMDIEIPYFNGYEIATRIRRGEFGEAMRNIPVVALTAHDTMEEKQQAEQVGIDAFLAKPFSPQTLLVVLDRVWERFLEGKTGRNHQIKQKSGIFEQITEALEQEQWTTAQNMVQDFREDKKGTMSKELNELSFRLLLQIRRKNSGASIDILEKLQGFAVKGVEYEDPRR